MTGNLVSAATSVAGNVANIFMQRNAYKERLANLDRREKENENWYNQRYNEDATQRADAQAMLEKTREAIRERNADAKGTTAVMGGTEESLAASKAANARALSDTASNIAVNADARKDSIENSYRAQADSLENQRDQILAGRQQAMANAITGIAQGVGEGAKLFDPVDKA